MGWPKGRPRPPMSEEARRKISEAKKGHRNPAWKGGRTIRADGYILVYAPDHPHTRDRSGYVLEHRLVMEQTLGRLLLRGEIVHHINGKCDDNRPENLAVMSPSEHIRHHATGHVKSPELRAQMSAYRIALWKTRAHPSLGRTQSPETREKIRQKALGRKRSAETRAKMSASQKARTRSP